MEEIDWRFRKHAGQAWEGYVRQRGSRYRDCRLDSFECNVPKQSKAIEKLNSFVRNAKDHAEKGEGLLLFGPVGTGKDHLLAAAFHATLKGKVWFDETNERTNSHVVEFFQGSELFGLLKDLSLIHI